MLLEKDRPLDRGASLAVNPTVQARSVRTIELASSVALTPVPLAERCQQELRASGEELTSPSVSDLHDVSWHPETSDVKWQRFPASGESLPFGFDMPERPLSEQGRRYVEALLESRLSQAEVMRRAGLSPGYLSKLKYGDRGARVEPEKIFALARVLDVEPQWLWLGEGPMRANEAPRTALETAIVRARGYIRSEAVDAVITRYKETEFEAMATWANWFEAFLDEDKRIAMLESQTTRKRERVEEDAATRVKEEKARARRVRRVQKQAAKPATKPPAAPASEASPVTPRRKRVATR